MEVYTLDPLLRRENVIDNFESLIWSERYATIGDFELDIQSTVESRRLLTPDKFLAMNESHRVMIIETVEDSVSDDGSYMLKVKGRSLESLLESRVAKESLDDLTLSPKWIITDTPGNIIRKVFHDICVLGILDPGDVIPFMNEGTFMPEDTTEEPPDIITIELEPQTVYNVITDLCEVWNLGFRILRHLDTSQLYFDVYTGSDRTSSQTDLPAVVFTPELDNLQKTKELTTIDKAKNVAYVYSTVGFEMVYAAGVDPEVEGFERRVLMVNATDVKEDTPDISTALIQKGNEELAKVRVYQAFDGEINQSSQFKYGIHYTLGDLVETRNTDGVGNIMRVTEQIFVSDREGERTYPTLTVNTFINAGSWIAWLKDKFWVDMGEEEYWDNQP